MRLVAIAFCPSLVAAALTAAAPAGAAETAAADGAVDSVVVFADRARVTRARAARCDGGTARVTFDPLPAALDARTLRGDARDRGEVIGVTSTLVNEDESGGGNARARELGAARDKLDTQIRAAEAENAAAADQRAGVDAYGGVLAATLTEEIRNPAPNVTAWARSLDALRARSAAAGGERRKL